MEIEERRGNLPVQITKDRNWKITSAEEEVRSEWRIETMFHFVVINFRDCQLSEEGRNAE